MHFLLDGSGFSVYLYVLVFWVLRDLNCALLKFLKHSKRFFLLLKVKIESSLNKVISCLLEALILL